MNPLFNKIINLSMVIVITLIVSSCTAVKKNFLNSSVVPAAQGTVEVKKDKNNNYNIKVNVNNLADPSRLQPAKEVYLVWMESAEDRARKLGRMETSSGMLTSGLKASFETVSTLKPRKIYISAEDDAEVTHPGTLVVLTSEDLD